MSDLDDRLAALNEAARLLGPFAPADVLDRVLGVTGRAEARLGLGSELTVAALAGSTGSGKSSLFNAVTGLHLAQTGVRRPTTELPLACVWGAHDAQPLLDWLDVPAHRRVGWSSPLVDRPQTLDGLVLLDLPDHDSMITEHREQVDRLVAVVDLMVWVTDPVKYADALLHEQYLSRLSRHGSVLVVVMNQTDRLHPTESAACLTDLRRLVSRHGIVDAPVLGLSAATGAGVPELVEHLRTAVASRRAAADRLAADVAVLAEQLQKATGLRPTTAHRPGSWSEDEILASRDELLLDGLVAALAVDDAARHAAARCDAAADLAVGWSRGRRGGRRSPAPDTDGDRANRLIATYLDQATVNLPGAWRADVTDRLAAAREECVSRWVREVHGTGEVPSATWWVGHRRQQRLVVLVAAIGLIGLLALAVLAVVGSFVDPLVWAAGVVVLAGAAVGAVGLHRRGNRKRADDRKRVEQDVRAHLDAMIRAETQQQIIGPARVQAEQRDAASDALQRAMGDAPSTAD